MKKVLKSLLFKLPKRWIALFYRVYNRIIYPNMREEKKTFGTLNPQKTIYVIRPRTDCVEGLMSLFLNVLRNLSYAQKRGFIPFVDFENYKTQYHDNSLNNSWENFFLQPSGLTSDEVYHSKSVILSGLNALDDYKCGFTQNFEEKNIKIARSIVAQYIRFSQTIQEMVLKEQERIPIRESLGLYLRGTDYIRLKPAGHPVQPSAEQACAIVDSWLNQFPIKKIFLVTEDAEMYEYAKNHFGEKLCIASFDSFITKYQGDTFLSKEQDALSELGESPTKRGQNYLCKEILLSQCKYFVGGNTCGSWAAFALSSGFEKSYVFDLGIY